MKIHPATIAILVLLVIAAFLYEHRQTAHVEATVATLSKEREAMNRQLRSLDQLVADLKTRESAPPPAVEPPRLERLAVPPPPPVVKVEPVATPGVTITAPTGWSKNGSKPGSYVVGVDSNQVWAGQPSAYVKSTEATVDGFGGMMQMASAENYLGKRVRLSGWAKTEGANDGGGHLWFRVDGQQAGTSLQFDNMDNRAIKGSTDWQHYSVVLDVPAEAAALAYGFFVQGTGQMWVSGAKMEEVGRDVPSTNMIANRTRALPKAPSNLEFR